MRFDEFLITLGLERRLNLAEATKTGSCSIEFDSKVTINIEHDAITDIVQAYCIVGPAPPTHRDAFFSMLLQAHMFGAATDGCTFGFQPQQDQTILFKSIDLTGLDGAAATKQMESLVNQSIRWTLYLPHLLEDWEEKVMKMAVSFSHHAANMNHS